MPRRYPDLLQSARRYLEDAIARAPADPRNHIVMARAVAVKALANPARGSKL